MWDELMDKILKDDAAREERLAQKRKERWERIFRPVTKAVNTRRWL